MATSLQFFVALSVVSTALPFFSGVFLSSLPERSSCFSMISLLDQLPEVYNYKLIKKMGGFLLSVIWLISFLIVSSRLITPLVIMTSHATPVLYGQRNLFPRYQSKLEPKRHPFRSSRYFLDKKKSLWIRNKESRDGWMDVVAQMFVFSTNVYILDVLVQKINRSQKVLLFHQLLKGFEWVEWEEIIDEACISHDGT